MFEVNTGSLLSNEELIKGNIPRISAKSENNGIIGYFSTENLKNARHFENFISVNFFGTEGGIFYHPYKASVEMKVHILKIPNIELNRYKGNFIVSSLKKVLKGFGYGNQLSSSKLKNLDLFISLPIKDKTKGNKVENINFDFMEDFIKELEDIKIKKVKEYLKENNLDNTTLTKSEKEALEKFENNQIEWGEFRIGDLFYKVKLRRLKKDFDKEEDLSTVKTNEFNLPLVNAKDGNNGIMYYGRSEDFESVEMSIDIVNDGAVFTGNVYPQPKKTGVLYNAYLIKTRFEIKEELLYFFATSIFKSIKKKFGYENKASWEKVKNEKIKLPIKDKTKGNKIENIDFDFMENFIRAIEKSLAKKVVNFIKEKNESKNLYNLQTD